jgi:Domain of unknown function (DUF932)
VRTARDHAEALTLSELAAQLEAQQATKVDYVADTQRVGFHAGQLAGEYGVSIDMPGDDLVTLDVNKNAHEQIGGRLGVPRKYYDRMRSDAPALLVSNVQHWFDAEPEKRMFRALDGKLRAVLSDRYRRLDNFDLMQHLLPELGAIDGLEFFVTALTPERMFIRATLPGLQAEVKVGDTVQAGVEISNSEIGQGSLQVRPYLLRLICMNGMVSNVALRKYHTGRRVEESEDMLGIFRDETMAADDRALFMKAADLVRASLTEVSFLSIVDQLRDLTGGEQIARPVAATQVLTQKLDLNEQEGETLLSFLAGGGDLSQWGVINALTETAKYADSFGRLVELEAKAGELVGMGAQEWATVTAA